MGWRQKTARMVISFLFVSFLWGCAGFARASNPGNAVKVAICQILVIDSDREGNFRRIEYALAGAKAQAAELAAFPESAILA